MMISCERISWAWSERNDRVPNKSNKQRTDNNKRSIGYFFAAKLFAFSVIKKKELIHFIVFLKGSAHLPVFLLAMALDVQTFKTRSLTAVVFAAVVVTGLCWNIYSFITLCLLILVGCLVEFYQLNRLIHTPGRIIRLFIPLVYLLLPIGLLLDLGITQTDTRYMYDPLLPCGIMFSIWINDTMAYLAGSLIGKTPLSAVSPKKTWEGTLGGILLSMAIIGGLGYGLPIANRYDLVEWILISAAAAVFGTIGDLLESKWKRMAGVKDSGRIMPGHGGFLDRFDSLLLATPAVWLLIHWLIA